MRGNRKKTIIIICLLVVSIILSSCKVKPELKNLAIVRTIGLDMEEDNIIITCEISNPRYSTEGEGASLSSYSVTFVQGEGSTLFEAIKDIPLYFDRRLFFPHAEILILGEDFAKEGIVKKLDYFLRAQQPRESIKMIVAKGTKAYEVMGIMGELSFSEGQYISGILEESTDNSKIVDASLTEFYKYYYDINNEAVIGVVEKEERTNFNREMEKTNDKKVMLNLGGGAVMRKDALIGYFTPEEALGFNFIVDNIKGGVISFDVPGELNKGLPIIGDEGKFTSIGILKSKTKQDVKIIDENIHLDINVKLRGDLMEESQAIDLNDKEIINIIEKYCSKEVERIISRTFEKCQNEFGQDNFSVGKSVHRKYPELWEEIKGDWNSIFSEISYNVNVETTITKAGIINLPSNLGEGK